MNKVIKILDIPKSTTYYKKKECPRRKLARRKEIPLDAENAMQEIASTKATYGVPRIKAVLRRDYGFELSKYLVHRYMRDNDLLIKRFRTRGPGRDHSGKIEVEEINTRWASDITSIKCWNGEKIRLAVILDCCDRSVISWIAGKRIQACDVELMVQDALIKRFGDMLPPKGQLQFLHDNGLEFIEKILARNLNSWNIESCNTPVYSPQSNGLVESFNGTFKRDYVYESCLDDADSVLSMIPKWLEEYNTFAPHSALGMKTPTEFFNLKEAA